MCVAVPAELTAKNGREGTAKFSGNSFNIDLTVVPHAKPGDYVLVHAGCATQVMRKSDAMEMTALFNEIEEAARGNG